MAVGENYGRAATKWRARAARAVELRATCTHCGRAGLTERSVPSRGKSGRVQVYPGECLRYLGMDDFGDALLCRGQGYTAPEIAVLLGVGKSTVSEYLRDPNRARVNARKAKYKGECADCGGPCEGSGSGKGKAAYRCRWCQRGEISPHRRATSPTGFRDFTRTTCGWGGPSRICRDPAPCPEPKVAGGHLCQRHSDVLAHVSLELRRELKRTGRFNRKQRVRHEALEADLAERVDDFEPLGLAA